MTQIPKGRVYKCSHKSGNAVHDPGVGDNTTGVSGVAVVAVVYVHVRMETKLGPLILFDDVEGRGRETNSQQAIVVWMQVMRVSTFVARQHGYLQAWLESVALEQLDWRLS